MMKAFSGAVLVSAALVLAGCGGSDLDGTYVGYSNSTDDDAIVLKVKRGEAVLITAVHATKSVDKQAYKADVDGAVLTLTAKDGATMVLAKLPRSMDLRCQSGPCARGELPGEWKRMLVN